MYEAHMYSEQRGSFSKVRDQDVYGYNKYVPSYLREHATHNWFFENRVREYICT